jgi:hypothetical protein
MPEPVSSPIDTRGGVRGTGRAPSPPSLPQLSAEAAQLIAGLPIESEERIGPAMEKLMRGIVAKPSRAGAEVLNFSAAAYRKAGNEDAADRLAVLRAFIIAQYTTTEAWQSGMAKLQKTAETGIKEAYAAGFAAGQAELVKSLPAVVRETTFTADDKGRITGKTEREFKPGGKS